MSRLALLGATVPVVAYAWWSTGLRPFSWPALVAVEAAGIGAMALGARRRGTSPPPSWSLSDLRIVAWGALLAGLIGWELAAYVQAPRAEHPTLSSIANAALQSHQARAAAFVVWLVLCGRLARR